MQKLHGAHLFACDWQPVPDDRDLGQRQTDICEARRTLQQDTCTQRSSRTKNTRELTRTFGLVSCQAATSPERDNSIREIRDNKTARGDFCPFNVSISITCLISFSRPSDDTVSRKVDALNIKWTTYKQPRKGNSKAERFQLKNIHR